MNRQELESALAACEGHTVGEFEVVPGENIHYGDRIFCGNKYIGFIGNSDESPREGLKNAD